MESLFLRVELAGPEIEGADEILSEEALGFVADLHQRFEPARRRLIEARAERYAEIRRTGSLDFPEETAEVRSGDWQVAPAPEQLTKRKVELTGPTERKMTINALNSGADVWLADFEDANAPTWANMVGGQVNLHDANRGTIELTSSDKTYRVVADSIPTIVVRPRGWHLLERHLRVDGEEVAGALMDFGLYFFHNRHVPWFYLPKLESYKEARLWNDVFTHAQEALGVPHGSIRATVLIETVPAAFQMDDILYELRDHASGLNAGRWDYLFSLVKCFRDSGPAYILPDRNSITMTAPMMRAYTDLLVATCHRRGAFAIGGMAAFIPSRQDPEATAIALDKVRADKRREANDGFDGSWVAHPDLVDLCREEFDTVLGDAPNALDRRRDDVSVGPAELLDIQTTPGEITHEGLRANIEVGLRYIEAWLRGQGAAAINNLMEDVATAEICRSQVWQWVMNEVVTSDGTRVTRDEVGRMIEQEYSALSNQTGRWADARSVFEEVALSDRFIDFLTLTAYRLLEEN